MSDYIEALIKCRNSLVTVRFEVGYVNIGNDGIGSFEFQGTPGFDKGADFVDEFTVEEVIVWSDRRGCYMAPSSRLLLELRDAIQNDEDARAQVNDAYRRDRQDAEDDAKYEAERERRAGGDV